MIFNSRYFVAQASGSAGIWERRHLGAQASGSAGIWERRRLGAQAARLHHFAREPRALRQADGSRPFLGLFTTYDDLNCALKNYFKPSEKNFRTLGKNTQTSYAHLGIEKKNKRRLYHFHCPMAFCHADDGLTKCRADFAECCYGEVMRPRKPAAHFVFALAHQTGKHLFRTVFP